jgi:hypothetical protein
LVILPGVANSMIKHAVEPRGDCSDTGRFSIVFRQADKNWLDLSNNSMIIQGVSQAVAPGAWAIPQPPLPPRLQAFLLINEDESTEVSSVHSNDSMHHQAFKASQEHEHVYPQPISCGGPVKRPSSDSESVQEAKRRRRCMDANLAANLAPHSQQDLMECIEGGLKALEVAIQSCAQVVQKRTDLFLKQAINYVEEVEDPGELLFPGGIDKVTPEAVKAAVNDMCSIIAPGNNPHHESPGNYKRLFNKLESAGDMAVQLSSVKRSMNGRFLMAFLKEKDEAVEYLQMLQVFFCFK